MITADKVTEIFCIIDEFSKNLDEELRKNLCLPYPVPPEKRTRNRKGRLSESEIMTIMVCYHFGTFGNFKHYYVHFIQIHMKSYFPEAVSYNRFVELMPRMFFPLMMFLYLWGFGHCSGISFVDPP